MNETKIALGLSNGIDYEIKWDEKILSEIVKEYGIRKSDIRKKSIIESTEDLLSSLLYFMSTGEGASFSVSDIRINRDFAERFGYKITIGGSGARAAIAIDKLGYNSILHLTSINDDTRRLLPRSVKYFSGNSKDTFYPHLIIQYPSGARIKANDIDITAPRHNRLMYLHDPDIQTMPISSDFFKASENCAVLLIGGFTTVPDPAKGMLKAEEVIGYIKKYTPPSMQIYYEDSCPPMGIEPGHTAIWRKVAENIAIFGLNEDELQNHLGRKIDLLSVDDVMKALDEFRNIIPCRNYVLHTKYYALAYGDDADRYREPLISAVGLATTRLVYGDCYTSNEVREIISRPADPEGMKFTKTIDDLRTGIVALPSFLVTEKNVTTIGLGDAFVGGFLAKLSDEN